MAEIEVRGLSKTFGRVTAPTCCRRMRTDGRTDTSGSAHARFWSLTRQQVRDRVIAEAVQARLDMRYPDSRRGYGPGGGVKIAWVPTRRQMTWACPAIRSWP